MTLQNARRTLQVCDDDDAVVVEEENDDDDGGGGGGDDNDHEVSVVAVANTPCREHRQ